MPDSTTPLSGIYCIRHDIPGGKWYVGSSINIASRWRQHKRALDAGNHRSKHLQNAWNKHGHEAFAFEVLEHVDCIEALIAQEQWWICALEVWNHANGYNTAKIAGIGSQTGLVRSEDAKARMRMAQLGKKRSVAHRAQISASSHGISDEHRKVMVYARKASGYTHSQATRDKISIAKTGVKLSAETCAKLSAAKKGRRLADAHRQSIRKAKLGKPLSAEHKASIANSEAVAKGLAAIHASNIGKPRSDETKEKLRAANLGKKQSPETIAKKAAAMVGHRHTDAAKEKMRAAALVREAKRRENAALL